MDPALLAGLSVNSPLVVILVRVRLGDWTIRWTDGGFVPWDDDGDGLTHLFEAEDEVYGVLSNIEEIEDGADNQATRCAITILPPGQQALADLAAPSSQGSEVNVWLGAVDRSSGLLVGTPDPLFAGELDFGTLAVGAGWTLNLECGTEEARALEPNADQRLSDPYHKAIWGQGERGFEHVTNTTRKIHWTWRR